MEPGKDNAPAKAAEPAESGDAAANTATAPAGGAPAKTATAAKVEDYGAAISRVVESAQRLGVELDEKEAR